MKSWKLVSGILSIVLTFFVLLQSCAAGVSNSLQNNGEVGGSAGVIVAIALLAGGITSVATRAAAEISRRRSSMESARCWGSLWPGAIPI